MPAPLPAQNAWIQSTFGLNPADYANPAGDGSTLPRFRSPAPGHGTAPGAPSALAQRVLESLTIYPETAFIPGGGEQPFSATGDYSDGTSDILTNAVIWSSSDPSISIDVNGVAHARPVSATASITATDPGTRIHCTIEVTVAPPQPGPSLRKITITPANPSLVGSARFGQPSPSQQFQATGLFADNSSRDLTTRVEWRTSAPKVISIDQKGLATVGSEPGTATITATDPASAAAGAAIGDSTTVKVTIPVVQSIAINPSDGSIDVDETRPLAVVRTYSDGTRQDLAGAGKAIVSWTSSGGIAVDENGVAYARQVGPAEVTAKDNATGHSATIAMKVIGERSMPTPFGEFSYFVTAEKEVKPLLTKAVQMYAAVEPLDAKLDEDYQALIDADKNIGQEANVKKAIDRYTTQQTKRDASSASSTEMLDDGTRQFVASLERELTAAEANVAFASNKLQRAHDTEFVRYCKTMAEEFERNLHAMVVAGKLAANPKSAVSAALDFLEMLAKSDDPWKEGAASLQQQIDDSDLNDAVASLKLAHQTLVSIRPEIQPARDRLKKADALSAEMWRTAEKDYDTDPANEGLFRFENLKKAIPLAEVASNAALRTSEAASGALDAASALARPHEAPSSWMANIAEDERIVAAMVATTRGMFEQAIAKHNDAKAMLKRFHETYAAARDEMTEAPDRR